MQLEIKLYDFKFLSELCKTGLKTASVMNNFIAVLLITLLQPWPVYSFCLDLRNPFCIEQHVNVFICTHDKDR